MSSPWNHLYDRYRDRRNGGMFFFILSAIFGFIPAICLMGYFTRNLFPEYADQIAGGVITLLALLIIWFLVKLCRAVIAWRRRAGARANLSKLSSDELVKARSKLLRKQNRISL